MIRNIMQNITNAVGTVLVSLIAEVFSDWMNMTMGMLLKHEGSILAVILNGM